MTLNCVKLGRAATSMKYLASVSVFSTFAENFNLE